MPQIVEYNGSRIEFPDGMPPAEIEAAIKKNALSLPAAVSAGKTINSTLSDIPHQLGLTARYAMEGLGNTAQVATEPVTNLMRMAGIPTKSTGQLATTVADAIGLPSPQGANERVVGDATRLMAGAGGMGALAGAPVQIGRTVSQLIPQTALANNMGAQVTSAAGAGLAGGASREGGGSGLAQAGASLVGGVAGGLLPGAIGGTANLLKNTFKPSISPQQLDVQLTRILEQSGTNFNALPDMAKSALRTELRSSLQAGKEVDPVAVGRLADFASVRGATPTRGMVTQDPVQITREMNLAKIGANSGDGQLQGLARIQNDNNTALIGRLNELGGRSETDALTAGRLVQDRISGTHAGLKGAEQSAWDTAKASPGYTQPIFPDGLNAANVALGEQGMMGFMPKQISDYMAAFQSGQQPFTPQAYRNLQSMLSGAMAEGGNTAAAAGIARRALESTPLKAITETGRDIGSAPVTMQMAGMLRGLDAQPQSAIDAVNAARAATAAQYRYADSSPLVRTALSGGRTADPEKIAQSFILNGTLNDARSVAQEVGPQGLPLIRDALATYIKKQAVSGASDEVGKVSQSALNNALRKIGKEKLSLFFSPEDIASLRATGRVASYMQNQPIGSAVNNSNSGALLLGRGSDLLNKIPVVGPMFGPALQNINVSLQQRAAQNLTPGLLAQQPGRPVLAPLLLPSVAFGGGLLSQ